MKILIIGSGKVGQTCTKQLSREGHDIILVDQRAELLETMQEAYDVSTITGNGAAMSTMKMAGIEDMDILIAVSNADEINLLACVTAKKLNPHIKCIARIRDPQYIDQAYEMRKDLGLSLVVNPEFQAAHEIGQLIKIPGTLTRESFVKSRVEMIEIRIDEHSKLAGKKLSSLPSIVHTRILVCSVERDGKASIPNGDFVLKVGDHISVAASPDKLFTMISSLGLIKRPIKHVLLIGGGRISYYLAMMLHRAGITVNIIEQRKERCEELAATLPSDITIVHGDASSQAVLDAEELGLYDACVTATGIDEMNIILSMYASLEKVPVTITKFGRGESARLVDSLPIGPIVCPKELCTNSIVRYVRAIDNSGDSSALSMFKIADGNAEVLEFVVDEHTKHIGEPIKDMPIKDHVLIVMAGNGKTSETSNGDTTYQVGDTVIVVAGQSQVITKLNDIFED